MLWNQQALKIAVFRALQLGDLLCVIPAVRALRNHFPEATISLIGLPWAKEFTDIFSAYFNEFIEFPGHPGLPERETDFSKWPQFLESMQQRSFNLFLQMHGSGELVNPLLACFNAERLAGFYRKGQYKPGNFFIEYPGHLHEVHRHIELVKSLEIKANDDSLEWPLAEDDRLALIDQQLKFEAGSYVCIHPGARANERRWPVEYFAAIADVISLYGYHIVLTGTASEEKLIEKLSGLMKSDCIIAAGRTSLRSLAALINDSALLVSNCTGVAHLGSALRKKSLVISLNEEPWRWAPLNRELHHTIAWLQEPSFEKLLKDLYQVLSTLPGPRSGK